MIEHREEPLTAADREALERLIAPGMELFRKRLLVRRVISALFSAVLGYMAFHFAGLIVSRSWDPWHWTIASGGASCLGIGIYLIFIYATGPGKPLLEERTRLLEMMTESPDPQRIYVVRLSATGWIRVRGCLDEMEEISGVVLDTGEGRMLYVCTEIFYPMDPPAEFQSQLELRYFPDSFQVLSLNQRGPRIAESPLFDVGENAWVKVDKPVFELDGTLDNLAAALAPHLVNEVEEEAKWARAGAGNEPGTPSG